MYNNVGTHVPGDHHTVAVASLFTRGAKISFFSLRVNRGEVVTLYITLVELLMLLSLLIALAEYFDNRRDK